MSRSPRIWRRRWAAAVSCSRPVVDAKWMDKSRQVGSSGQTVRPKVYLACGISGSFQHLAGLKGNPFMVAINKNPNAPIFRVADVGIVADILEFLPALAEQGARREVRSGQGEDAHDRKEDTETELEVAAGLRQEAAAGPGADRPRRARRVSARDRPAHVQSRTSSGIQLLFIPEEYGGFGGGAFDVYCICEEMARDRPRDRHRGPGDLPRQRPDHGRRDSGAEEALADAHRRRGRAVRLRRHRARRRQRPRRAADHGRARR